MTAKARVRRLGAAGLAAVALACFAMLGYLPGVTLAMGSMERVLLWLFTWLCCGAIGWGWER